MLRTNEELYAHDNNTQLWRFDFTNDSLSCGQWHHVRYGVANELQWSLLGDVDTKLGVVGDRLVGVVLSRFEAANPFTVLELPLLPESAGVAMATNVSTSWRISNVSNAEIDRRLDLDRLHGGRFVVANASMAVLVGGVGENASDVDVTFGAHALVWRIAERSWHWQRLLQEPLAVFGKNQS